MLSSSFTRRPLMLKDAETCTDTINAITAHIGTDEKIQPNSILLEWRDPAFDLGSSSLGLFDAQGKLAGYVILRATADVPVHPFVDWGLHPDYQAAELAAELLRWAEDKSAEVFDRCPPEARISLRCGAHKGFTFAENALAKAGYVASRTWYDMEINMAARPGPAPFPDGLRIRPYRPETDLPMLVDVVRDSFSDHFGNIEQSFEKDLEMFRHWFHNNPHYDPALVILAADEASGEIAGCLIGLTQDHRNAAAGYIDTVGVRRAYRRRGLATAMLKRSLTQFWERGTRLVRLDVDGQSLTNAVALYERVGMHVFRHFVEYEKVLREGLELAKVALE